MTVRIDKSFEKDVKKVRNKKVLIRIADTIEQVQTAVNTDEIKNIKKLKGSNNYYRIRVGNFRIGISIEGDKVSFIRFLARKDIYKYFP